MSGGHGHSHGDKPCGHSHGDVSHGSATNADIISNRTVAEQAAPLRFALGAKVECKMSPTMWMKGTVTACNYREAGWPADKPAIPYQVELTKSKEKIFAPYDFEDIIRADTAPHTSEGGAAGDSRSGFAGVPENIRNNFFFQVRRRRGVGCFGEGVLWKAGEVEEGAWGGYKEGETAVNILLLWISQSKCEGGSG